MSSLVKTRPANFNNYYQLLTQLKKAREIKAYLQVKTVGKHWQLASVYLNESCTNIPHAAWEIFILISRWVDTYHTIYDEGSIKQPITITIPCDRFEKRILPVHFRMAWVLTFEMVSQLIISIIRRSLGKLK